MTLLAEPAGRLLERTGNRAPRGMTVHDRTRLIGQLHFIIAGTCSAIPWACRLNGDLFRAFLKPHTRFAFFAPLPLQFYPQHRTK